MDKDKKPPRIIFFDIFRIFAIFLVVFAHILRALNHSWGNYFGVKNFYYVSLGGVGVTLFLVLSGMVLEYNYGNRRIGYFNFIIRRVERIYPIYWLSLIFSVVLLGVGSLPSNIWEILLNLTGFSTFTGKLWSEYIIPIAWFIGLIVSLYFLYPFLSKLIRKYPNIAIILVLIVSIFFRFYVGRYWNNVHRPLDWFPLCRLFEFSFGIWLARNKKIINIIKGVHVKKGQSIIKYLSDVSFPVFLIHLTLLKKEIISVNRPIISIVVFLLATLFLSTIIMLVDREIQTRLFRRKRYKRY